MSELSWSDVQWQKVNDAVKDSFGKASVASAFLECYGPLAGSAETVRNERLIDVRDSALPISLDGDHDAANLKLVNLTVQVELSSEQIAEEALSNAILAFRRAANILAQEEDRIVFEGYRRGDKDSLFVVNSIRPQKGLADMPGRQEFPAVEVKNNDEGQALVLAVVNAIKQLEDDSNTSPFACVLGNQLFTAAYTPTDSLVLPADRITPLLRGGPLLRSGQMNSSTGIVVSLAGKAIDLVVGTPPSVQFLQRTDTAKFLFRVYERFVLRIRDKATPPVAGFVMRDADTAVSEAKTLETLATSATRLTTAELNLARARTKLAQARQRKAEAESAAGSGYERSGPDSELAAAEKKAEKEFEEAKNDLKKAEEDDRKPLTSPR